MCMCMLNVKHNQQYLTRYPDFCPSCALTPTYLVHRLHSFEFTLELSYLAF